MGADAVSAGSGRLADLLLWWSVTLAVLAVGPAVYGLADALGWWTDPRAWPRHPVAQACAWCASGAAVTGIVLSQVLRRAVRRPPAEAVPTAA